MNTRTKPYSVRRARSNLLAAIRYEIYRTLNPNRYIPHSAAVADREAAIRDLIRAVRYEARTP